MIKSCLSHIVTQYLRSYLIEIDVVSLRKHVMISEFAAHHFCPNKEDNPSQIKPTYYFLRCSLNGADLDLFSHHLRKERL